MVRNSPLGAGGAAGAALGFGFPMPTFLCRFLGATAPSVLFAIFRGDGLHLILALTMAITAPTGIRRQAARDIRSAAIYRVG